MQGSEETPKAPLGNNARPLQPLHHRTVRTNIDFQSQQVSFPILQKIINLNLIKIKSLDKLFACSEMWNDRNHLICISLE